MGDRKRIATGIPKHTRNLVPFAKAASDNGWESYSCKR
jgi:hypothetical protein